MSQGFRVVVAVLYAFLLAPLIVVVIVSFNWEPATVFPPPRWSVRWYAHVFTVELFVRGAMTSAWLAVAATLVSTPIALAASIALVRGYVPGRHALEAFLLAPLVVPGVVVGIALLASFATVGLRDAPLRLLAAHVLITLPYSVRTIVASLARLDTAMEEAAMTLGASPGRTFWHVTLPLIRPGVAAGMIFSFIISFDNVPVSLFLTDARTPTLPLAMMSYLEYNFDPSVAAISAMLIGVSVGASVVLERVFGLKRVLGM
jgi:putative spermidine/putrescine transport system permease protein